MNNTSYPNPSTDTTPVANSIDSVAVVAGMDLIASIDNYIGTWRNLLKVEVWDMHISNNGEMLIDSNDCWLNFSNLCKLEPTIQNIFQHYDTDIYDYYTKETSRGTEVVLRADYVYRDSNSFIININQVIDSTHRSFLYVQKIDDMSEFTWDLAPKLKVKDEF